MGLRLFPVCFRDPVCPYIPQCGMKHLPSVIFFYVDGMFAILLITATKLAVENGCSPCSPAFLIHWFWGRY